MLFTRVLTANCTERAKLIFGDSFTLVGDAPPLNTGVKVQFAILNYKLKFPLVNLNAAKGSREGVFIQYRARLGLGVFRFIYIERGVGGEGMVLTVTGSFLAPYLAS